MNNEKIAKLKKQIKHYTPEIIAGTTVLAGVAALAYIKHELADAGEMTLTFSKEEWNGLENGATVITNYGSGILATQKVA